MDYQLKGLILKYTLKSYTITPIESVNVLKVTMRFYGDISTRAPVRGGGTGSGRKKFLVKFRRDPILVPLPFLEPGQTPLPVPLEEPVLATMEATLLKQVNKIEKQIRGFTSGGTV